MHYYPKKNLLFKKNILISGAGDGIGREVAITYAKYGAFVILLGKTENNLNQVKKEIKKITGVESRVILLDLSCSEPEQYHKLTNFLFKKIHYLDGLLNNAGILGEISLLINQNITTWLKVINVNVNGTFMLTQALLPLLLKSKNSSIIFSTSNVGKKGRAKWGAYAVSKFATEGMMSVLSKEYTAKKLRVNCINPGKICTKMRANAFPEEDPTTLKKPKDIMSTYLYLMGKDSKYHTGMTFNAQND